MPGRTPNPTAWLLGVLFVGTLLAVDPWGFSPFTPARAAWATTVGLLAVAAATRAVPVRLHRAATLLWLALLLVLLVATLLAVDPVHAWIGTPERRFGWLTWLLLGLLCAAGQVAATEPAGRRIVVRAAAVAAVTLGAYTGLERLDAAPVDVAFLDARLGGPFGQPAYLGAAAALLGPVALGLAFGAGGSRRWRWVGAAGAAGAGFALLGSQTRGALLGVGLAGVVVVALRPSARRRAVVIVPVAVVAGALLLASPIGDRSREAASPGGVSNSGRLDEWRVAAGAVVDRPLLGAGPEGYRVVFGSAVDQRYEDRHGRDVLPDRAHMGALDVAVTGGVPAGLLYVALAAVVAAAAVRLVAGGDAVAAGLASGLIASLVQEQLLFPTLEVGVLFWPLAGVALAGAGGRPLPLRVPRATGWVLVALAAVALVAGATEVMADRRLEIAADRLADGDETGARAAADGATDLRPDSIRNWYVAARVARAGGTLLDLDAAIDRIEHGLDVSPRDPALRRERVRLLSERASRSGLEEDARAAVAAADEALVDDPLDPVLLAALDQRTGLLDG